MKAGLNSFQSAKKINKIKLKFKKNQKRARFLPQLQAQ